MIGTNAALGMRAPSEAMLFIIATYIAEFSERPQGLRIIASTGDSILAWPRGNGFAKIGGNYGPTLQANTEALDQGYDQVLWLFGKERRVTEAGASNYFVVWTTKDSQRQLVTAPLDHKMVLEGVTRRSVLQLARERQFAGDESLEVVERDFTMVEVIEAINEGPMIEAFVCGTAYFVSSVSKIGYEGQSYAITMRDQGYTFQIRQWLKNIKYGGEQHVWGVLVNEKDD